MGRQNCLMKWSTQKNMELIADCLQRNTGRNVELGHDMFCEHETPSATPRPAPANRTKTIVFPSDHDVERKKALRKSGVLS